MGDDVDRDRLREQAARCRRLGAGIDDRHATAELLKLACDYEALLARLPQSEPRSPAQMRGQAEHGHSSEGHPRG